MYKYSGFSTSLVGTFAISSGDADVAIDNNGDILIANTGTGSVTTYNSDMSGGILGTVSLSNRWTNGVTWDTSTNNMIVASQRTAGGNVPDLVMLNGFSSSVIGQFNKPGVVSGWMSGIAWDPINNYLIIGDSSKFYVFNGFSASWLFTLDFQGVYG